MIFTSTAQFQQGMEVEAWLDSYFAARGWVIERATAHQERVLCKGDRLFRSELYDMWVEYKSGIQTFFTGNVFLETVSVDTENKPGWVFTCQADMIVYAALLNKKLLLFDPSDLRKRIGELQRRFRTVATRKELNTGYRTHGVIVPLAVAEKEIATAVLEVA